MTYIPKWLAIADEVRTKIIGSKKDIYIPEQVVGTLST